MNIHTAIHVLLAQVLLSFANAAFAFRKRESISLSHHRPMYIYGGVANNNINILSSTAPVCHTPIISNHTAKFYIFYKFNLRPNICETCGGAAARAGPGLL